MSGAEGRPQFEFTATVMMKKPWSDMWVKKPTKDDVLESFAHEILNGNIDKLFEIKIEKIK